jgi:hypothetical protein
MEALGGRVVVDISDTRRKSGYIVAYSNDYVVLGLPKLGSKECLLDILGTYDFSLAEILKKRKLKISQLIIAYVSVTNFQRC